MLNRSHQETAEEKSIAEQILKDSRQEHEELLELRSMFSASPRMGKPELQSAVTFPYMAKHRIVLFGGHASWLRAVRPLLKNVRFVEPEVRPNTSLFVNADCIWLQNNAMKHSDFYKIVNLARQYNIPVFYFQYASAEKCVEQLALEDEKFTKKS